MIASWLVPVYGLPEAHRSSLAALLASPQEGAPEQAAALLGALLGHEPDPEELARLRYAICGWTRPGRYEPEYLGGLWPRSAPMSWAASARLVSLCVLLQTAEPVPNGAHIVKALLAEDSDLIEVYYGRFYRQRLALLQKLRLARSQGNDEWQAEILARRATSDAWRHVCQLVPGSAWRQCVGMAYSLSDPRIVLRASATWACLLGVPPTLPAVLEPVQPSEQLSLLEAM